jgi:hypothetical protein
MATVFDVVAAALLMRANREAHKRLMLLQEKRDDHPGLAR